MTQNHIRAKLITRYDAAKIHSRTVQNTAALKESRSEPAGEQKAGTVEQEHNPRTISHYHPQLALRRGMTHIEVLYAALSNRDLHCAQEFRNMADTTHTTITVSEI